MHAVKGLLDWRTASLPLPTDASIALAAVVDKLWLDASAAIDVTQPYMIMTRNFRIRRSWRGKRFSYTTNLGIALKQVEIHLR